MIELFVHKADVFVPVHGTVANADVYFKEKADEAITELKALIADLEGLNHDLCERVTENDGIRQHWEEIEQTRAENERLKAKLVEQDAENRRLKRALWLARGYIMTLLQRDFQRLAYQCNNDDYKENLLNRRNRYYDLYEKCRAKMEEYK